MTGRQSHDTRKLRAPQDNGASLVSPPIEDTRGIARQNTHSLHSETWFGTPLDTLRKQLRSFTATEAVKYTAGYANNVETPTIEANWIVSGHQPELFHPGVWFKNFVLEHARKRFAMAALHLIIDSDLCQRPTIRVPVSSAGNHARIENIAFDVGSPVLPFEERTIIDESLFATFDRKVTQTIAGFVKEPLIAQHWATAIAAARETNNIGLALSQFRHRIELKNGSRTLELPLSRLCESTVFAEFVRPFILEHESFLTLHNQLLLKYRTQNRIRSKTHPFPELRQLNGFCEIPFWIWTKNDPIRRPLFVRSTGHRFEFSDLGGRWECECTADDHDLLLSEFNRHGLKIRTRALTTTMFVRVFLADIFLHGIGGAVYDRFTDQLIDHFASIRPPAYQTATATIQLPVEGSLPSVGKVNVIRQLIRQAKFHPEKFLSETQIQSDQVSSLVRAKEELVGQSVPLGKRKNRHDGIARVNRRLQAVIREKIDELEREKKVATRVERAARVLMSREFSFCLFPERQLFSTILRQFCNKGGVDPN